MFHGSINSLILRDSLRLLVRLKHLGSEVFGLVLIVLKLVSVTTFRRSFYLSVTLKHLGYIFREFMPVIQKVLLL